MNNNPIKNYSPVDQQYNSPIENQINNNIIYINNENDHDNHKFGSNPYSKYLNSELNSKKHKLSFMSYSKQKYSR